MNRRACQALAGRWAAIRETERRTRIGGYAQRTIVSETVGQGNRIGRSGAGVFYLNRIDKDATGVGARVVGRLEDKQIWPANHRSLS